MNSSVRKRYRIIGAQLARYIRERSGDLPSQTVLQAVVADLAAAEVDLVLPLKALVAKPSFRALSKLAGSGGGAIQRDALLGDLKTTFSLEICEKLADLINGFLDLPPAEGIRDITTAPGVPSPSQLNSKLIASKIVWPSRLVARGKPLPKAALFAILVPALLLLLVTVFFYKKQVRGDCLFGKCYGGPTPAANQPSKRIDQRGQQIRKAAEPDQRAAQEQERRPGTLIGICKSGKELYSLGFIDSPNAGLIESANGEYVRPNVQKFKYDDLVFTLSESYRGGDFSVYGETADYANNSISINFSNQTLGFSIRRFNKNVDECAYLSG